MIRNLRLEADRKLGWFCLDRAREEDDEHLLAAVEDCFDHIDITSFMGPTRYVLGEVSDPDTLREIATRWIQHPDYPLPWY